MLVSATALGMVSGVVGLLVSFHAELPAGPAIILVAGGVYAVSLLFGREGGLVRLAFPGRHLEA
jgi:zinc/manganese transport system permease protein